MCKNGLNPQLRRLAAIAEAGIYLYPEETSRRGEGGAVKKDKAPDCVVGDTETQSMEQSEGLGPQAEDWALSDLDWDGSDVDDQAPPAPENAPTECACAYTFEEDDAVMAPASKRQKLRSKVPPPCVIPPGYTAVRPVAHPESRLARELGCTVYVVDWKTLRGKSRKLQPLHIDGQTQVHPVLHLLAGKEKGSTYYASTPLWHSPSARAILEAAADVQEAYKRLTLLLSPSTTKPFAEVAHVEAMQDIYHKGVPVTDGQSEVSPETARQLGLLPSEASQDKPCLYSAWQVRGLLKLASGHSCLCKGMLMVNTWVSKGIWLREQCRKVQWLSSFLLAEDAKKVYNGHKKT